MPCEFGLYGTKGTQERVEKIELHWKNYSGRIKIKPFPVILFGSKYWKGFLEWLRTFTLARGYISEEDLNLLRVCDDTDEVIETVRKWYLNQEIGGRRALVR